MKIKCPYCENYFDDANAVCPHCSAPNSGVVRTAAKQPLTIEQLKDWYASKGLPPYETTRFFIGEDYRGKRAFGIYRDAQTGNVVVYKNKDSGERAIRYRGTDEAYAVNEIFQRLKQEIIQQKGAKANRSAASRSAAPAKPHRKKRGCLFCGLVIPAALMVLLFVGAFIYVLIENAPREGYYTYEHTPYYFFINEQTTVDKDWFRYDGGSWSAEPLQKDAVPKELRKNRNAKHFFMQTDWSASLSVPDFKASPAYYARMLAYEDAQNHYEVSPGYYQVEDHTYYHYADAYDEGWYYYDSDLDDWDSIDADYLPGELLHESLAQDFYYTPDWSSETQISDFADSLYYTENAPTYSGNSYDSSSSWDDDDDYDYSWDSSDDDYSWDSGSSDWDSDW